MPDLHEKHESLWVLAYSPAIWAVHFLLCYITAAIWCAKVAGRDGTLNTVQVLVGIYTVLALAGIVITCWRGYRRHRFQREPLPHDEDSPEDRYRFIGYATVLLSALSFIATVWVAMVVLFIDTCN